MGDMVEDLLRPEAYPAPRPEAVSLRVTHASWVFLAGDDAWKVKRPVDLGFLDFSTPDDRRRCCQEEVRLGERLAPGVYRGVAPVFAGASGHAFAGGDRVVDHAVRMRRLPDEDSAAALVAAGRLTPAHLGALAARLAGFYAQAACAHTRRAGERLASDVEDNFTGTARFVGTTIDAAAFEEVRAWQRTALGAHAARLAARDAGSFVREGHGDLRLEHVYFDGGAAGAAPLVIDPIEFNDAFRWVDQALDVAFLAMELDLARREDLAAGFLSDFARETGDYGFYPLLDLYLGYRAWVRAKVACLLAADGRTDAAKARRKTEEAVRLVALALGYARRRPAPAVIAVGGLVGAGKSTLAAALARGLGGAVVSSDATRKQLGGLDLRAQGGAELYTPQMTARTEEEVARRAAEVLASGRPVILDATFRRADTRARARALARRGDCAFLFVEARAQRETLAQRLRDRAAKASVSDAREDLLAQIEREWQPPDELPAAERIVVDAATPLEERVGRVRERL